MKTDIVKTAKAVNIVSSLFICAVGVFILLFPNTNILAERITLGVICILLGLSKLLGYFCNDTYRLGFQFGLGTGIVCIAVGVLAIAGDSGSYFSVFPLVAGLYATLEAGLMFQTSIDARRFGISKWWLILTFAAAIGVLGVLNFLAYYLPVISGSLMLGLLMIIGGAVYTWVAAFTVGVRKKKRGFSERFGDDDEKSSGK